MGLTVLLLASSVFAGGQPEGSETVGSTEAAALRISWWGSEARHEKYDAILTTYEAQNPGVDMSPELMGWAAYWDRLATQAAARNAPDIVHMVYPRLTEYATRGVLLDLTPYVEDGTLDLSQWNEAVVDSGRRGGELVGISIGNSIVGTLVNSSAFERLGVEAPQMDWTWEEMLELVRTARQAETDQDIWIMSDASGWAQAFYAWVRQRGGDMYTADGQLGFSEEDMVDWFVMWKALRDENVIPPPEETIEDELADHANRLLSTGRVLIHMYPSNQLHRFQQYLDDTLDLVRIPRIEGAPGGLELAGALISVSSTSEDPRAAVEFVNWFVNSEDSVAIFGAEHGALGNAEMNELISPDLSEPNRKTIAYTEYAAQFTQQWNDYPSQNGEIMTLLRNASQAVMYGISDIPTAVENFFQEANRVLSD